MPANPVSRANAWALWSKGQITATNAYMTAEQSDPQKILTNLAVKRGHNAIRLWFGYAGANTISREDIVHIATSDTGWDDNVTRTKYARENGLTRTYADVAAYITQLLTTCSNLGIGVVLVAEFDKEKGGSGALWSAPAAGQPDLAQCLQDFWLKTYAKWIGKFSLIGLDLMNEPAPNLDDRARTFEWLQLQPRGWPQIAQNIVQAIRTYEDDNGIHMPMPLIVEGVMLADARGLGAFDGSRFTKETGPFIKDPQKRIVYSFHYYDPTGYTHAGMTATSYEAHGTPYPMSSGCVADSYWNDGQPTFELRSFATVADVQARINRATQFADKFGVPIFVGEFSAGIPRPDAVHPKLPTPRSASRPNQRVSDVQNTDEASVAMLGRLMALRDQPTYDSWTDQEKKQAVQLFNNTGRRWITQIDVTDTGDLKATMAYTTTDSPWDTGFGINYCPKTISQLVAENPGLDPGRLDPGQWIVDGGARIAEFYLQPNARVVAPAGSKAAAFDMATPQQVRLQRHDYIVKFRIPLGAQKKKLMGFVCTLAPDLTVMLPVALLWLDSPFTDDQVDQARFTWARDALHIWQKNRFSWAWHCDDTDDASAMLGWRPSQKIGELLGMATSGRQLAART